MVISAQQLTQFLRFRNSSATAWAYGSVQAETDRDGVMEFVPRHSSLTLPKSRLEAAALSENQL